MYSHVQQPSSNANVQHARQDPRPMPHLANERRSEARSASERCVDASMRRGVRSTKRKPTSLEINTHRRAHRRHPPVLHRKELPQQQLAPRHVPVRPYMLPRLYILQNHLQPEQDCRKADRTALHQLQPRDQRGDTHVNQTRHDDQLEHEQQELQCGVPMRPGKRVSASERE